MYAKSFGRAHNMRFVGPRPFALKAANRCDPQVRNKIRILAVSLFRASPPGIARQVQHRCEALLHPSSSGLCRCGSKNFAKQIRVPGRGKRDGLWIGGAAWCYMPMQAFVVE